MSELEELKAAVRRFSTAWEALVNAMHAASHDRPMDITALDDEVAHAYSALCELAEKD